MSQIKGPCKDCIELAKLRGYNPKDIYCKNCINRIGAPERIRKKLLK
jgi:hypothetical protein